MNPQQPGQNPYDFILAPQKAPVPKAYLPGGNSGKGMRIALIAGAALFVVILFVIVGSFLSKPNPNTTQLVGLAETQQEINRVAMAGDSQTNSQGLKNSSITVALTLLSHQNQTITYLGKQNIKVSLKQLGLKKSATTDTKLKTAIANSSYDIVYGQVLQSELQNYASELKTAYSAVTGANARKLLKNEYADAQRLTTQLNNSTSAPTGN
jgi:hypothetical protein